MDWWIGGLFCCSVYRLTGCHTPATQSIISITRLGRGVVQMPSAASKRVHVFSSFFYRRLVDEWDRAGCSALAARSSTAPKKKGGRKRPRPGGAGQQAGHTTGQGGTPETPPEGSEVREVGVEGVEGAEGGVESVEASNGVNRGTQGKAPPEAWDTRQLDRRVDEEVEAAMDQRRVAAELYKQKLVFSRLGNVLSKRINLAEKVRVE